MVFSGTHKLPKYLVPMRHSGTEATSNSPYSKSSYVILAGHSWDDCWELDADLHVEVSTPPEGTVVVTCLNLQEYGAGDALESAVQDLLTSLSDYYQSLESREDKLAPSAIKDLQTLRKLLRMRAPADNASGR